MNNEEWLRDGRKIPDEVMGYIRKIAVEAVRERGHSPEVVAEIFNFNRSCIYRWLNQLVFYQFQAAFLSCKSCA